MPPSSAGTTPGGPPRAGSRTRRPSLYTTVLSLAIAAIAATWLPFSVLYINALSKRPAAVTALAAPAAGHPAAAHATSPTPVTTRVS